MVLVVLWGISPSSGDDPSLPQIFKWAMTIPLNGRAHPLQERANGQKHKEQDQLRTIDITIVEIVGMTIASALWGPAWWMASNETSMSGYGTVLKTLQDILACCVAEP